MSILLKCLLNPTYKCLEKTDSLTLFLIENNVGKNSKNFISSHFSVLKRFFHLHAPRMKEKKSEVIRRDVLTTRKNEYAAEGEHYTDIDSSMDRNMCPTFDLPERLFDGIPFKSIPVVYVRASKRNTKMILNDNGTVKVSNSCGKAGFKNCKKGTAIAAQTTGTYFGVQAVKQGYKNVRVIVQGLGIGRLSALKGLQLSGINVISITDCTKDIMTRRPKKQRRL